LAAKILTSQACSFPVHELDSFLLKVMSQSDDEMFDDLHQGVFALRKVVESEDISLSQKATETLNHLEKAMPVAKSRLRAWKDTLKTRAVQAAKTTDKVAREYPWTFTLGALGLGLLAGILLSNSNSNGDSE
jgi:ElaB/YqjD/DUF883 family membrane-anchored ribosome-binding protein